MSPAGDALAMLPPSVPRFWIWAAPIGRGRLDQGRQELPADGRATDRRVGRERPEDERVAIELDPAQLVEPPQVEQSLRPQAEAAGQLDEDVGAAGDRAVACLGQQGVSVSEAGRRDERRFDHRAASGAGRRLAARAIDSMILV